MTTIIIKNTYFNIIQFSKLCGLYNTIVLKYHLHYREKHFTMTGNSPMAGNNQSAILYEVKNLSDEHFACKTELTILQDIIDYLIQIQFNDNLSVIRMKQINWIYRTLRNLNAIPMIVDVTPKYKYQYDDLISYNKS